MANNDPLFRVSQGMIVHGGFSPIFYANAFSRPLFPVITDEHPNEIQFFHWGLIPSFVRSSEKAAALVRKTVNARSETVFEKSSFAPSALKRRCVIPVTGFYEWHDRSGKKYPFFIRVKGTNDFGLAGIWNLWTDPADEKKIPTFAVLTTHANPLLAKIHLKQRMPVILTPAGEKVWLDPHASMAVLKQLFPPFDGEMEAWPVQKIRPGSPENHRPEIQRPVKIPELTELLT